ncbi:MAG TPA: hypothetical protein VGQ89_00740, partial [Candidatus Limnocylindrales bacterium]|nr:hypothetical protein [Candidatus Limnocylindrales bacterium]
KTKGDRGSLDSRGSPPIWEGSSPRQLRGRSVIVLARVVRAVIRDVGIVGIVIGLIGVIVFGFVDVVLILVLTLVDVVRIVSVLVLTLVILLLGLRILGNLLGRRDSFRRIDLGRVVVVDVGRFGLRPIDIADLLDVARVVIGQ